ncbi:MAG TPA: EsaB/YukD family protein [Ktedonobacterales bacterium]|jgi:hypothetical protein
MSTVLVTVLGPRRRVDLDIPCDVPISDLIIPLLGVCGPRVARGDPLSHPASWGLGAWRGAMFPASRTLIDCGVVDGGVLVFQDIVSWRNGTPQLHQDAPSPVAAARPPTVTQVGDIGIKWNPGALLPGS